MDLGLKDQAALVMASSRGIGKAIAYKLAEEGANVMICSRSEKELVQAAEDISANSEGEVHYTVCDITDGLQVMELVQNTVAKFGKIDILVNNAGGPPAGIFENLDDDDWQQAFELNLLSYIRVLREAIPYMQKQNYGRIVNIASSSIKEPIDGLILSNTFRTGIMGLGKSLATELGPHEILVNTLGPGRIQTDRIDELEKGVAEQKGISKEEVKQATESTIPLGRYGTPEEFANMAVFLCSKANSYITGQSFLIDGGKTKAI